MNMGLSKRFSLKMWSQKTGFMSLAHFKRKTFLLGRATPAEAKPAEEYLFQKTHKYFLMVEVEEMAQLSSNEAKQWQFHWTTFI